MSKHESDTGSLFIVRTVERDSLDDTEFGVEATYEFDTRKSARHFIRRNVKKGYIERASIAAKGSRTPLVSYETDGVGGFRRIDSARRSTARRVPNDTV